MKLLHTILWALAFVVYRGGMDDRTLMLSRKNMQDPNADWVTIEFPHQHIGFQGNPNVGDSHNTAAIGICTIDETIHILYDMHAYSSDAYPDDFFNYSVSIPNAAFVPDEEFNLSLFNLKRDFLKPGQNYERVTYPTINRVGDGSLVVRFRRGGAGNGEGTACMVRRSFYTKLFTLYFASDMHKMIITTSIVVFILLLLMPFLLRNLINGRISMAIASPYLSKLPM